MNLKNGISPEIQKLLEAADSESIRFKMLALAVKRARFIYHISAEECMLPGGHSLDDIPSYIWSSLLNGTRKWNPEEKDLETWCLNQVNSVLDWWMKLRESRDKALLEKENNEDDSSNETTLTEDLEIALKYGPPDPEEILVTQESAQLFMNALFDDLADDVELENLLLALIDAKDPEPRFLAETLGLPVEEIYKQKRRLKNHVDKVQKKLERITHATG